jgi:hypothetical protein
VLCSSAVTWWFLAELSDELVVPPEVLLHHVSDHLLRGHLLTCPAHAINQSISKPNQRKQQNPKLPFYLRKFSGKNKREIIYSGVNREQSLFCSAQWAVENDFYFIKKKIIIITFIFHRQTNK